MNDKKLTGLPPDLQSVMPSCASCYFLRAAMREDNTISMRCKRYPAKLLGGVVGTEAGPTVISQAHFLVIDNPQDEWCGEWRAKD